MTASSSLNPRLHAFHSEVRQTALLMLPSTKQTFPAMILRTRDVDPVLRRNVYLGALSLAQIGDPRHLSIAQREELVKCGLGDRDDRVRRAAAGMISSWVDKAGSLDEVREHCCSASAPV